MRQFKTLIKNQPVELITYVKDYIKKYPDTEVLIGCDSQNRKKETIYAIVIGLYKPKKGAHVLYTRFTEAREKENVNRLINEVWFSTEVAEQIKNEANIKATWIDIDLNPDPKFKSNAALTTAVGIVIGMGYNVRHKGHSPLMTYAADHLVK